MKSFLEVSRINVSPVAVAKKIISLLDKKFSNRIFIQHDDNLLTIVFDLVGPVTRGQIVLPNHVAQVNKKREEAKKLASVVLSNLNKLIVLEDSSITSNQKDPTVSLFMVSDSFIGMPSFKILKESAQRQKSIKVGDKIRTIRGGQMSGTVTKIDGDKIHFDHATATYQTAASGAKGKPKQYVAHISNIIKESEDLEERCWDGYKPTPGKKPYEKGSCMKEEDDEDLHEDAEYDGRKVTLNKPFRTTDGPKKFAVYVKNDKGNVVKVAFGDPNMEIKRDDPERRANYRARHNCSDPGPKWKANYWSCKMWSSKPVSKITNKK